jgi:O-antigen/teichoic acid export membrane protein
LLCHSVEAFDLTRERSVLFQIHASVRCVHPPGNWRVLAAVCSFSPLSAVDIGNLTRRVAKGSGIVFAGQVAGKLVGVCLQAVLSRGLGKMLYGTYTLAFSIMQILRQVGAMGLHGGVVRFSAEAQAKNKRARVKGTLLASLGIGAVASLVLAAGLYGASDWLASTAFQDAGLGPVLRAFAIACPFYVMTFLSSRAARGLQVMLADVAVGTVAQPLVNLLLVSGAFLLGYGLDGAVTAFVGSAVVSGLLGLYVLMRIAPVLLDGTLSASYNIRGLLAYSLPVMGVTVTALLVDQADRVMLGLLASSTDVGLYNVAALLATQVRFMLTSISATFTPLISDLYHTDRREELHQLLRITTRWIVTLSMPLALVLALFPDLLLWIFGTEFRAGAPVVLVLAIGSFLNAGVGTIGLMLQMSDHERLVLLDNIAMAVLNIALNLWLIPLYGPVGAALATALSITAINAVQYVQLRYLLGMTPFSAAYLRPIAAGVVAGLSGWGASLAMPTWVMQDLVGMLVTGLVYLGTLLLIGLPDEDWEVMHPFLQRTGLDRFLGNWGD